MLQNRTIKNTWIDIRLSLHAFSDIGSKTFALFRSLTHFVGILNKRLHHLHVKNNIMYSYFHLYRTQSKNSIILIISLMFMTRVYIDRGISFQKIIHCLLI